MSGRAAVRIKKDNNGMQVKVAAELSERSRGVIGAINRRAYEIFEAGGCVPGRELDDWFRAESELLHPVHLEVQDLDSTLIVKGALIGFSPDELEVKVEPRVLTIAGERRQPKGSEGQEAGPTSQHALRVFRTLELPEQVETESATARIREGILEVTLSKAQKTPEVISNAAA